MVSDLVVLYDRSLLYTLCVFQRDRWQFRSPHDLNALFSNLALGRRLGLLSTSLLDDDIRGPREVHIGFTAHSQLSIRLMLHFFIVGQQMQAYE